MQRFDDVLGYCRYSANPVGHLVLYVCGYRDAERQALSDFTCTALQLANFWQDVSVDYAKGRIYLPLEDLRRFGVERRGHCAPRATRAAFCEMMRFEVERARDWFQRGSAAGRERWIANWRSIIELFSRGGQEILNAIERQGYDVLGRRPAISKSRKLALVARAALGKLRMSAAVQPMPAPFCAHRIAAGGGLLGVPQHHAFGSQEFLLRLSGAAAAQASGAVRGLCLHAAL